MSSGFHLPVLAQHGLVAVVVLLRIEDALLPWSSQPVKARAASRMSFSV